MHRLGGLPLLDLRCGPDHATVHFDDKHIIKRLRGLLISSTRGCQVSEGEALTGFDIKRLLELALANNIQLPMRIQVGRVPLLCTAVLIC